MGPAPQVRAGAVFWCVLCAVWLVYAGGFSIASPGGQWTNAVYGSPLWAEEDPGGFYLPSAHQIFEFGGRPLFPGHPGASLHLLLYGVQRLHYMTLAPDELGFTAFTARHLGEAWIAAKITMTLVFLLSFFLLYRLARRLTEERAAVIATLAFATSLPVLYFLSRISVEGLMVVFFIATLLCIGTALDRVREQQPNAALAYSFLAGAMAISGVATKLNFLGPLPFFGLFYVVAGIGVRDASRGWRWTLRVRLGASFAVGAGLGALVYLPVIHVGDFKFLWSVIATTLLVSPDWTFQRFLPAPDVYGIFQLCEALFIVMGLIGWARYFLRTTQGRAEALWLTLYLAFATGLWAFRVAWLDFRTFHYFFLPLVGLSIFFGFLGDQFLEKVRSRIPAAGGWVGVLALVFAVHCIAIVSVTESRINDVREYGKTYGGGPVFALARTLGPEDRIDLLPRSVPGWYREGWYQGSMTGFSGLRSTEDCPGIYGCFAIRPLKCPIERNIDVISCAGLPPRLLTEFNSLFRLASAPPARDDTVVILPKLGRAVVVRKEKARSGGLLSEPPAND